MPSPRNILITKNTGIAVWLVCLKLLRYYSWAIPGANGQWGGPLGSRSAKDSFEPSQLRPQALDDFSTLYLLPPSYYKQT